MIGALVDIVFEIYKLLIKATIYLLRGLFRLIKNKNEQKAKAQEMDKQLKGKP